MGMSTHVTALRDISHPEMQKHLKVLKACIEAGVPVPSDTANFLGRPAYYNPKNLDPGEYDAFVEAFASVELKGFAKEWKDGEREGYEVDVKDIPPTVKTLRFYNSW